MRSYGHRATLRAFLTLAIVLAFAALSAATFFGAAAALLGMAIGSLVGLAARSTVARVINQWSQSRWRALGLTLSSICVVLVATCIGALVFLSIRYGPCELFMLCSVRPSVVQVRHVAVKLEDLAKGTFAVTERLSLRGPTHQELPIGQLLTLELPTMPLAGQRSGFFLWHAIVPGPVNRRFTATIDGRKAEYAICAYFCPDTQVELRGLPSKAFYAARASVNLDIPQHPDPIAIRWNVPGRFAESTDPVEFWYHPSPSSLTLVLLAPLARLAASDMLLIAGVAFLLSILVGPVVVSLLQSQLKLRLTRLFGKSGPEWRD